MLRWGDDNCALSFRGGFRRGCISYFPERGITGRQGLFHIAQRILSAFASTVYSSELEKEYNLHINFLSISIPNVICHLFQPV